MSQPKFIITADGFLRLGMVNMHKDLLLPGDVCIGGGYYQFDYVSNRLILDRKSYDYGKPKWHWLDVLKVPSVYRGLQIVYIYDDGEEFDLSQELKIEYYD
ncbi:MAG: hypothetical protein NC453_23630 [Muribaculum sp.]|nr:hypothetical protein [Muribaculum sp.]